MKEDSKKQESETSAGEESSRLARQREIIDLFGTIDYDPAYDYRVSRQRDRMPEES